MMGHCHMYKNASKTHIHACIHTVYLSIYHTQNITYTKIPPRHTCIHTHSVPITSTKMSPRPFPLHRNHCMYMSSSLQTCTCVFFVSFHVCTPHKHTHINRNTLVPSYTSQIETKRIIKIEP